jgi:hypothetical protein
LAALSEISDFCVKTLSRMMARGPNIMATPPGKFAQKPTSAPVARQQHVNSKWRFIPILFLLCLHIYWPFRFDFAGEFVFRTTLT